MISLAAAVATAGWAGTTTIPATPDSAHAGGVLPESFLSYAIGFASFPDLAVTIRSLYAFNMEET